MRAPSDLERRMSRRIDQRKGIMLQPEDLDLLVMSGAYERFRQFVTDYQKAQCRNRDQGERSALESAL